MLNELLRKKTIESNFINLKKLLMVGQTKIENYVDDNLKNNMTILSILSDFFYIVFFYKKFMF